MNNFAPNEELVLLDKVRRELACNSHYNLLRQRDELLEALNSCLLYFQEQKDGTRAGTHPKELFDLVDGVINRIEQEKKGE